MRNWKPKMPLQQKLQDIFDSRLLGQPSVAVETAKNEVITMGNLALDNIKYAAEATQKNDQTMVDKVYGNRHKVDLYEKYLTDFL